MKKLILTTAFVALFSLGQGAVPGGFDPKFVSLVMWMQNLCNQAMTWNAQCDESMSDECTEAQQILNQQFAFFISAASSFGANGDSVAEKLKARIIKHEIRLAAYNIGCTGKQFGKKIDQCQAESKAINAEDSELKSEVAKLKDTQAL